MKKVVLVLVCLVMAQGSAGWAQERDTEAYTLGPEDAVQIQVWQRADLSGTFTLDNQGNLTLPLLGEVHAEGITPADLGRDLARRYAILDSGVSEVLVSVAKYNSRYLTIVGEVRSPGRYSFQTMPTIWDAILAAGGESPQADLSVVEVVRREARAGEAKSVIVDLSKGMERRRRRRFPSCAPATASSSPRSLSTW